MAKASTDTVKQPTVADGLNDLTNIFQKASDLFHGSGDTSNAAVQALAATQPAQAANQGIAAANQQPVLPDIGMGDLLKRLIPKGAASDGSDSLTDITGGGASKGATTQQTDQKKGGGVLGGIMDVIKTIGGIAAIFGI